MAVDRSINPWNSSLPTPDLVPQYRGEWAAVAYQKADIVTFNSNMYIALDNTTALTIPGAAPTKWKLVLPGNSNAEEFDEIRTTADKAANSIANTSTTALATKSSTDGPQFVDGSRWVWAPSGTPNGGTVVAGLTGVWVRETGNVWLAKWFAIPNETDSSSKLQAAINALPAWGTLDGQGLHFNVLDLQLKSQMTLSNIRLTQLAGAVDMKSTLVIDGRLAKGTQGNITLSNVIVNGNRAGQTNVVSAAEDGGRHGLRIIGRVYDLNISDCEFNNCASDGVELYSSDQYTVANNFTFRNILFRRTKMNGNRRHGVSLDAAQGITFEDCVMQSNGLDLNTTDALTHGNRGSRFGGNLYGNGADVEGYGVGSTCKDIKFVRCVMTANARGSALWYTGVDSNTAGHSAWANLVMEDCTLDYGVDSTSEGWCVMFTPPGANKANAIKAFNSVRILNCTQTGYVGFISVDTPQWDGGENFTPAPYQPVLMQYCLTPFLGIARLTGRTQVETLGMTKWVAAMDSMAPTLPAPTLTLEGGQTGTLTATVSVVRTTTKGTVYQITGSFTADGAGTWSSFRVTPASETNADITTVGGVNNNTAAPVNMGIMGPLIYVGLPAFTTPATPVAYTFNVLVT